MERFRFSKMTARLGTIPRAGRTLSMHIPRRPLTGSSQAVRLRETLCGLRGFEHCSKHPRGVTCPACAGLLRNRLLPADPDPSPGTRRAGNPTSLKPPRTRTRRGRPSTVRSPASASGREVRDEPESPVRRRTRGPRSSGACARRSAGSSTTSDRGRSWHSPRTRSSTSTSRRRGAAVRGPCPSSSCHAASQERRARVGRPRPFHPFQGDRGSPLGCASPGDSQTAATPAPAARA